MQYENEEIIDRDPGYNNYEMWQRCELLKKVVTQTVEVKEGRGRNVKVYAKYKHNTPKNVIDRIIRSCEYYKQLHEKDMEVKEVLTNGTIQYRDYQYDIIKKGSQILSEYGFVYLAMEVRTGKTLTSLGIAATIKSSEVLFLTKKKAISSIEGDYKSLAPSYNLTVINYESIHKLPNTKWDLIVCDEAHSLGAFPKPNKRAEQVKELIDTTKANVILLSGTPTPESYSQMYHQVYGIPKNPFRDVKNFYRFCDNFVKVTTKIINGLSMNDYSKGLDTIIQKMEPFTINYTQEEAGFISKITEEVFEVELKESTYKLIKKLTRDLVVQGKEEVILGDTPVKLMMKLHQLYSGTIKFESGNSMVLDTSKAEYIKETWEGCQIAIFYKFKEELEALKQVFGDELTTELSVFEDTYKSIALQIVSGREGISLRKAEYLVYYNIDFSATSYWQSRDRMTTKDRPENEVFWIFSKGGIEHEIYKAVTKKKDYTLAHFKKDFYL
jgi:SNF2 family DNA or RNA helicase